MHTPLPRGAGRGTHHERILTDIREHILSRAWPPGFQLPFETELAERYGVSRMTMNKVLTELTRDGFLKRRRKLGTFVAAPRAEAAVMAISDIESEVETLGLPYGFHLLERALRPPTEAERTEARIDAADAGDVLYLRGLHSAGGAPFCLETRIINPAAAPGATLQDFAAEGPGKWLLKEIPWTSAQHRIRAVNAEAAAARLLQVPAGHACLEVSRRTELAGAWVTLAVQVYPGDKHQLFAQFEPRPAEG